MRIAAPFIFFLLMTAVIVLAYKPAPVISDAPDLALPVYSACQTDNDCALIAQPCGKITAVRKNRLTELNHYYKRAARHATCHGANVPTAQHAICTSSRCMAVPRDNDAKNTP